MASSTGVKGLKRARDGRFVLDRVIHGQRLFVRLPQGTDGKTAGKIAEKLIGEAISGRYIPESQKPCSLTVRELLYAYWEQHLINASRGYRETRKYHFDRIEAFFGNLIVPPTPVSFGHIDANVLTASHINRYIQKRTRDRINPTTIRDEIKVLSQAINFCMASSETVRISHDPIKGHLNPTEPKPSKIVLDEGDDNGPEWQAIYSQCSEKIKPLVLCLYETGMRPEEVFSMRREWWSECAEDRWVIEIPKEEEKTAKERRVPVSLRLLSTMKPILQSLGPTQLVFPSPSTGEIRKNGWAAFPNAVERVRKMSEDASRFQCFEEFESWASGVGWDSEKVNLGWHLKGFKGEKYTPYALRRTRLSVWDGIDENASRYAGGHRLLRKDAHNDHYIRFPLSRLFRLVGLEYKKPELRLVKVA